MDIRVEIKEATTKRLLILGIVLSCVLTVAVVHAVPISFRDGDVLTAAQLNQNFTNLETRLQAVESTVHPASGFHAMRTVAQTIPHALRTTVTFDQVEFDIAGEYNRTTGGFAPVRAGVYAFTCTVEFVVGATAAWYVTIQKNGVDLIGAEHDTMANTGESPSTNVITKLAVGDTVTCAAYQATGGSVPLYADTSRNSFGGARLD